MSEYPSLLVSYAYLKPFLAARGECHYRDWSMDSGAFSAFTSGHEVDLEAFIDCALELGESDPTLEEVFALDDIQDYRATLRNTRRMWDAGIEAIPTYHYGEPPEVLDEIAAGYPKIALGGVARSKTIGRRARLDWLTACFSRIRDAGHWPKRIHGFGTVTREQVLSLPFHSVDASSWEVNTCQYGNWKSFPGMTGGVRGTNQNLRPEIDHYLELEAEMRQKWGGFMSGGLDADGYPKLRLAAGSGRTRKWLVNGWGRRNRSPGAAG